MRAQDEPVAVYDERGAVLGAAPRGVVYSDGLWHAGTGGPVRSGDGARVLPHRHHAFVYEVRWDGPVWPQPEEVAEVARVALDGLRARLADPVRRPFTPDGRRGVQQWWADWPAG